MVRGYCNYCGTQPQRCGPQHVPYNVVVFAVGTVAFLIWAMRVQNKPQAVVNLVSLAIGAVGLYKAFG